MNRIFLLLLVSVLFSGCRTKYFMYYHSSLDGVKVGNSNEILAINNNTYVDSILSINCSGLEGWRTRKNISFRITNRSEEDIYIDWNNLLYINEYNNVDKMTRVGTNRRDNIYTQAPTSIPPGLSYSDVLRPTYNYSGSFNPSYSDLFFSAYSSYSSGFIPEHSMEHARRNYTKKKKERDAWKDIYMGKKEGVYLPIVYKGKTIPYILLLEIDNISVIQHNPDTEYNVLKGQDFPN